MYVQVLPQNIVDRMIFALCVWFFCVRVLYFWPVWMFSHSLIIATESKVILRVKIQN